MSLIWAQTNPVELIVSTRFERTAGSSALNVIPGVHFGIGTLCVKWSQAGSVGARRTWRVKPLTFSTRTSIPEGRGSSPGGASARHNSPRRKTYPAGSSKLRVTPICPMRPSCPVIGRVRSSERSLGNRAMSFTTHDVQMTKGSQ